MLSSHDWDSLYFHKYMLAEVERGLAPLKNDLRDSLATAVLRLVQAVIINHRGRDIRVSGELLYFCDILARQKRKRYRRMPETVRREPL